MISDILSAGVTVQKRKYDCVMHCNIPDCNLPLTDEGLICPCGHVFCGLHKPWISGKIKPTTCGFYCLLCNELSIDDKKVINLHDSRHVQTNGRGLVGVETKLAVSLVKHSVKVWMVQSRLQLKREVAAAREVHKEKQRRIMECRAETAAMQEMSRELRIYLANKRQEEQQSRRLAESLQRRLHSVQKATNNAKIRLHELKDQLHYERQRNAHVAFKLARAGETYQKLLGAFEQIRQSAAALREAMARRQQRNSRREQRDSRRRYRESCQRQHSFDRRELDGRHQRHRESRSRSRRNRLVPLPACVSGCGNFRYNDSPPRFRRY